MNGTKTLLNGASTYFSIGVVCLLLGMAFGFGVAQNKITYLEKEAEEHVSKEVFDKQIEEVIRRLERIETKLDR